MAVQANSRVAVSVALGADEGEWLLGLLLPQFPPGSLVDGILFYCDVGPNKSPIPGQTRNG
jgi:hypothetical protein